MEKFLIYKLDESCLEFFPHKISDLPIVMDSRIPFAEQFNYRQLKLTGDVEQMEMLDRALFWPKAKEEPDPFGGVFDDETKLEENMHDTGGEVPADKPSPEGAGDNS